MAIDMELFPTIALLVSWLLAAVFAMSARHKFRDWVRYKASFAAYELVPQPLVTPAAALLAGSEVVVVIGCLAAIEAAVMAAAGLLLIYGMAMMVNLLRGRRYIDCGCGDEPTPIGLGLLVRNGVLFGMAFAAAGGVPALSTAPASHLALAALGALVAYGIYAIVEQLFANKGRHQRLWLEAG